MYPPPYLIFNRPVGYTWEAGADPASQILDSLNDAPIDLLPGLTIRVAEPDALVVWLETNNAALITDLYIFVGPTIDGPSPERWCRLFNKLHQDATNLKHLDVYWDAEGPWDHSKPPWDIDEILHFGLGESVVFVRGLARLNVSQSVKIGGFYAKHWPPYLEEKLGIRPINIQAGIKDWDRLLKGYQKGTERLNPWTDKKDRRDYANAGSLIWNFES
ncbi:hypothetical protein P153DRAFT_366631 [Dothidotthia symphoricarpi CBS 119687]|uniref:Uncharacterized protein n=1 Tax=Dothidotthia symphoricarpi CBS 119687 TaxID=1392245 RepID=A0A6A6AE08_9PLEO|nr:uncharacterized protein P153DRAFT_366631 [Dothidotthia symphoricarpi CBS 119687]KAF2129198.1 hypothetical protein P153DRAFT_366631 [Dothidotthia symphoricarpi CBS 119687]